MTNNFPILPPLTQRLHSSCSSANSWPRSYSSSTLSLTCYECSRLPPPPQLLSMTALPSVLLWQTQPCRNDELYIRKSRPATRIYRKEWYAPVSTIQNSVLIDYDIKQCSHRLDQRRGGVSGEGQCSWWGAPLTKTIALHRSHHPPLVYPGIGE